MKSDAVPSGPSPERVATRAAGVRWRVRDVIDFEYFIHRDEDSDEEQLEARDRAIYLREIQPADTNQKADSGAQRRWIFRVWLDHLRTTAADPGALPGTLCGATYSFIVKLLILIGLIIGSGAAAALLHYEGAEPVNVSAYFAFFVLLQAALALVAVGVATLRIQERLFPELSILERLARPAFHRLVKWVGHHSIDRFPARERNRFQAFLGFLSGRHTLFGSVFYWPLFLLLQLFGVAFNAGVVGTTLALVTFSDRAFGWQSTVQFDATTVHSLAQWVSFPWAWAFPDGIGCPTLPQVEGTRIVLKEGVKGLVTENLISWWPFLCLAVATYGLLPRLLLSFFSGAAQRRALQRLDFSYVACDRILERMTATTLTTSTVEGTALAGAKASTATPHPLPAFSEPAGAPTGSCAVLVPKSLKESLDLATLKELVRNRFGWETQHTSDFGQGSEYDRALCGDIAALEWPEGTAKLVILQRAYRPPIGEFLAFVECARSVLGTMAKLVVVLVGKPASGNIFTEVKDDDFEIWDQQLKTLRDPYLRVEKLIRHG